MRRLETGAGEPTDEETCGGVNMVKSFEESDEHGEVEAESNDSPSLEADYPIFVNIILTNISKRWTEFGG